MDFNGSIQGYTVIRRIHNETGGTANFYFTGALTSTRPCALCVARKLSFRTGNNPQATPKPSSNVPFRKDNDFVDRGDILTRIDERYSQPAGRVALVGFGGFG
jgi:hypothetical protein